MDDKKFDLILERLDSIKTDITDIKRRVCSMEMTMENELHPNIMGLPKGTLI